LPDPSASAILAGMTVNEAEAFWDTRYRERGQIWSGKVNAVLADVVAGLTPGRALDLGCGEGGDAVWLAARGWRVTAVDVAPTALERTRAAAAEQGVAERVSTERHDLGESFPAGEFDLVSAQFLESPIAFPREAVVRRAAAAVAPGGLLLAVTHGSVPPWSSHAHEHFATPREALDRLELDLAGWEVERVDAAARTHTAPDGRTADIHDNVIALRRRSG
jgi:SAM-dependent methyltransferase